VSGWTLAFRLPSGTSLSSRWNGSYPDTNTGNGGQVTVTNDGWDATVTAGGSVTVGFVTGATGQAGAPTGCTIDGVACQAGGRTSRTARTPPTTTPTR
jgi:Cellulose binding domain